MRNLKLLKLVALGFLLTLGQGYFQLAHSKSKQRVRKVAIFVLDGVRLDVLQHVMKRGQAPFIKNIIAKGALAKGHVGPAPHPSISGFGWSSLTRFTVDHGVSENTFAGNRMDRPSFLALAKEQKPSLKTMAMVNWAPVIDHIFKPFDPKKTTQKKSFEHLETTPFNYEADRQVAKTTIRKLKTQKTSPDILFVGYDSTDHKGHEAGYSIKNPGYMTGIAKLSRFSAKIVKAIEARPSFKNEDWLYLVTTDHGGRLRDKTHINPSTEFTRRIWVAAAAGNSKVKLPKTVNAEDVSAIAFKYLGLKAPPYYKGSVAGVKFMDPDQQ